LLDKREPVKVPSSGPSIRFFVSWANDDPNRLNARRCDLLDDHLKGRFFDPISIH
jgi:hypothetical protein